jgi:hypothetical protein
MTTAVVPTARRRRAWPWIVLALLLAAMLLAAAGAASWVVDTHLIPVHVVIDGDEVWTLDPALLGLEPWMVAVGVLAALLVVIVVVPVALAIAFAALAIGLVFGLGVPLLVGLLVTAVALSPLLLLVALGVWLWRRSSNTPPPAANIVP